MNPALPAELERIIDKALDKDRNVRYQSAADLRADLTRLKRDTTSGRVSAARASSAEPTTRRRWPWAAAKSSGLCRDRGSCLVAAVAAAASETRRRYPDYE